MTCVDDKVIDLLHPHHFATAVEFSQNMPHEGSPETRGQQSPTKVFVRKFFNDRFSFQADVLDDYGNEITDSWEAEVWTFAAEEGDGGAGRHEVLPVDGHFLPAPPIVVREGDIVHCDVEPSKSRHTIHWHGIEPLPRNDGVGHTSFELTGSYRYQWRAARSGDARNCSAATFGNAGTYFYHCHVNTTLHVQMGMFGAVIVDPASGPGLAFDHPNPADAPRYDVEALWAPFAVDTAWHSLNHAAGLDGQDVALNLFCPEHVCILGQVASIVDRNGVRTRVLQRMPRERVAATDVRIQAKVGQKILIRLVNATYLPIEVWFDEHGRLEAEIIASDGRPLASSLLGDGGCVPLAAAERPKRRAVRMSPAERYDCLLTATSPGTYRARVDYFDWIQPKPEWEHGRRASQEANAIRGRVSPRRSAFTTIEVGP